MVLWPVCPEELAHKLKPLGDEERVTILKLKEKESQKRNLPFSGELHAWDMRYYMTQVSGRPRGGWCCCSYTPRVQCVLMSPDAVKDAPLGGAAGHEGEPP